MSEFKNKIVLITGGGTGIGRVIAQAFASENASVIIASRNKSNLIAVVQEIQDNGGKISSVEVDISCHNQVKEMFSSISDKFGRIDILVNNTGIAGPTSAVVDLEITDWSKTLETNLTGAMLCSQEALKIMIPQKSGNIVNISAQAGIHGFSFRSPYSVSKAGLINLTQTLAMEVGEYSVRVNCVSPGPVDGDRARKVLAAKSKKLNIPVDKIIREKTEKIALARFITPEEIANVAIFLASEKSSGINGQNLSVNGGIAYR